MSIGSLRYNAISYTKYCINPVIARGASKGLTLGNTNAVSASASSSACQSKAKTTNLPERALTSCALATNFWYRIGSITEKIKIGVSLSTKAIGPCLSSPEG